jgi:hypothetical protein
MSIFFQLPADLRERWWSAITLDEREAVEAEFHASQKPEKLTIGQMIADYAASDWCDRKESVFVLFVKDCYTQEERNEVMDGLMGCRCCSRHQEHKDVRHKPEGCETKEKGCKCNCRHYARLFKRNELA